MKTSRFSADESPINLGEYRIPGSKQTTVWILLTWTSIKLI